MSQPAVATAIVNPVRIIVTSATQAHAARIARECREADRRELMAGWGHTPEQALRHGLEHSSHVWTGLANMQAFCMVGVVPENLLCGSGRIWLVATEEIVEHQVAFLRRCRPVLARMQAVYQVLANDVAADNTAALHWLKWLGFKVFPARPIGESGELFHHFEWRRSDV